MALHRLCGLIIQAYLQQSLEPRGYEVTLRGRVAPALVKTKKVDFTTKAPKYEGFYNRGPMSWQAL